MLPIISIVFNLIIVRIALGYVFFAAAMPRRANLSAASPTAGPQA